jgi:hypothetical protein
MTNPETRLQAEPKPAAGGCCGSHDAHDHDAHDLDAKAPERASHDRHAEPAKATGADAPVDKPKAKHGSGCCCS